MQRGGQQAVHAPGLRQAGRPWSTEETAMMRWPHFPHEAGTAPDSVTPPWTHLAEMQREFWHRWWEASQGWLSWWLPPLPTMPPPAGQVAPPEEPPPVVAEARPVARRAAPARRTAGGPGVSAGRKTSAHGGSKTQRHH